jgi:uncharacterized protein YyaL (SSP411 family)
MTHHGEAMPENLLARESSPYLLQHKDNPVAWMPWGPEALARAKRENKPVLLSIGYASCHWCHVMAHESFENPDIARLMNEMFVNIKVDREERPDLDAIYQTALAMLGEHGGWPLTMFLNADGEPFWGGTYFPPEPRYGRPGFGDVLRTMHRVYTGEEARVQGNIEALRAGLARIGRPEPGGTLDIARIDALAERSLHGVDQTLGGLQGAPKFPQAPLFGLLWRAYLRTGRPDYARAVLVTLDRICQGGIYDHLGGGFARYSVDPLWLVPHFEKMLYDNALLVELLTLVWQHARTPLFEARVRETIGWVLREMVAEGGAFASSLDADSEGVEGRFYVWTEDEVDAALGADARIFKAAYDVSAGGNWEGANILNRLRVPRLEDDADEARLPELRARLLEIRAGRTRPGWDDKVLADWNGLMIAALAEAGFAFAERAWVDAARRAFDFISANMADGDRLTHSYRLGRAGEVAFLDDYANMARAALALYEVDGEARDLARARAWTAVCDAHYWDAEAGGYFFTADDAETLIARTKSPADAAVPAGNGTMLGVLARLYCLTGETAYRDRADRLVTAFAGQLDAAGLAMATVLISFELLSNACQIVIVGDREAAQVKAFLDVVRTSSVAARVLQVVAPGEQLPIGHPAHGKGQLDGRPTVYVCVGQTCSLPMTEPEALREALTWPKTGPVAAAAEGGADRS